MVPKGVIIDCCCVLIGINIGSCIKNYIPERIKEPMNVIFGISAVAIGIVSLIKMKSLPAVIFALVLGALIGEILDLDGKIKKLFQSVLSKLKFEISGDKEEYMKFYMIVAVTFCASGTNIFGAISEGITGDINILLSKGVMDIFAAGIFAATLGRAMNLIVLPQFVILSAFFYSAQFIVPNIEPFMMNDFIAVGGLLTLVLGLSIAKIKFVKASNLLPALVIVFPASLFFNVVI